MAEHHPEKQRAFAVEVVRQLRNHGFEAYWAGGCVRDRLLNRAPKDYDVATNARPEEIQRVFEKRRTLAIGAAFGVITVVGSRGAGQIEVTTFRQDATYSDGRHPDFISFSSPEEDAKRRDFTINGMFFDPVAERVIDFVGGEADLQHGIVRAIGDPRQRFNEDKLRMLRAVRFAAVFAFHFEDATLAAIREMAPQINVVSAERIAAEMRMTLVHANRVCAVELLLETGLLQAVLPEVASQADNARWQNMLAHLGALKKPTFPLALATLLLTAEDGDLAATVGRRWRLARKETERTEWLMTHQTDLIGARTKRWSQLQPLLTDEGAQELIALHAAEDKHGGLDADDLLFCQQQLQRRVEELNPAALVTGEDLIAADVARGPEMARLLKAVRVAQLDGEVNDRRGAMALVERLRKEQG